jgi:hypothetical protein
MKSGAVVGAVTNVQRLGQASLQYVLKLILTTNPDFSAGVEVAATARVVMAAGWAVAEPVAREASLAGDWAVAIVEAGVDADLGVAAAMAGEDVRETAAAVRATVEAVMAVAAALASDWAVAAAMEGEDERDAAATVRATVVAAMALATVVAVMAVVAVAGATEAVAAVE